MERPSYSQGGRAYLIDPLVDSCSHFILLNSLGVFLLWLLKDSWCEPFIVSNEAIVLFSVKICGMKQRRNLTELFPVQLLKIIPTIGAKNNWDQDKDQAIVAILCNSSSKGENAGQQTNEDSASQSFSFRKKSSGHLAPSSEIFQFCVI